MSIPCACAHGVCVRVCVCVWVWVWVWVCVCVCARARAGGRVCMCVCVRARVPAAGVCGVPEQRLRSAVLRAVQVLQVLPSLSSEYPFRAQ